MNLFDRAKQIGLQHIKIWLPEGKQDGNEWVCFNPNYNDTKLGSFKINLNTGIWADFSIDACSGGDAVSLYAYLHRSECEDIARTKKFKNFEGGVQSIAARLILERHDSTYFPTANDDFTFKPQEENKKTSGDYWENYYCLEKGLPDPPESDFKFYENKFGAFYKSWDFYKGKNIVMKVARFIDKDGKKNDRPFTLWTNGRETKWRSKALKEKYPLWNVNEIIEKENLPILLTEGQKVPAVLKEIIGEKYICTGWYGGAQSIDKTDFSPLTGRTVYYSFDADLSGRNTIEKIKKISCDLKIIFPPIGCDNGWDLADAVEEGWDKEKIINFIENQNKEEVQDFIDEKKFPFRIVGTIKNDIIFYQFKNCQIDSVAQRSVTKGLLFQMMDRKQWGLYYGKESGGTDWDAAINDIIRIAQEKPKLFDMTLIRGTGAWHDNGKIVVNTGKKIIVENQLIDLHEYESDYVYEAGKHVPYQINNKLTNEEANEFLNILSVIDFEKKIYSKFLAGWIVLAPWCGILKWRPHIWITGTSGSGKTWLINHLLTPLISDFGVKGQGSSSPAGIKQALNNSAKPIILDEMDAYTKIEKERMASHLLFFREASSGDNTAILQGTTGGEGRQWIINTMACFASVGLSLDNAADKNRFTILKLISDTKDKIRRNEKLKMLEEKKLLFTKPWVYSFHSRTFSLLKELLLTIDIMIEQCLYFLPTKRDADQIGTLLAGAYILTHDKACTAGEAKIFIEKSGLNEIVDNIAEKTDEEMLLDEILSWKLDIIESGRRNNLTIGSMIKIYYSTVENLSLSNETIKKELEQIGINLKSDCINIAVGHTAIKRILSDTPWKFTYGDMLERLGFCEKKIFGPSSFAGVQKRFRKLRLEGVINNGEEEIPF